MSVDRDRLRTRRGRKARGERAQSGAIADSNSEGSESWSPERHRVISGEEVLELLPALAAREPTSGYLFYDCQTDDVRLVLTVLGEAERFGAVCANRARCHRPARAATATPRASRRSTWRAADASRCVPRTW